MKMRVLDCSRGMGKTYQCVIASFQTGKHILVASNIGKRILIENAQKLETEFGKPLPTVYSVEDLVKGRIKEEDKQNLIIDDMDDCLTFLLSMVFGASACMGTVSSHRIVLDIDNAPSSWVGKAFSDILNLNTTSENP